MLAKIEPAAIIDPAASSAIRGNFLLTLRIPEDELSPSVISNQSGFFGVIVDPFRYMKDKPAFLEGTEKEPIVDC